MNKTAMILVLAIGLVITAGCIGEETEEEKIEMKDCGIVYERLDDADECFLESYVKCSPVKATSVEVEGTASIQVLGGTQEKCDVTLGFYDMNEELQVLNEKSIRCTTNTDIQISFGPAGGTAFGRIMLILANEAGTENCTGDTELINYWFGAFTSKP